MTEIFETLLYDMKPNINKNEVHLMDDLTKEIYIESSFKLKLFKVRKAILYTNLNPQVLVKCIIERV